MLRILKFALILLAASATSAKAQDASAILNIGVNLIQCGQTQADLPRACKADSRCCVFMEDYKQEVTYSTGEPDWQTRLASNQEKFFKIKSNTKSDI